MPQRRLSAVAYLHAIYTALADIYEILTTQGIDCDSLSSKDEHHESRHLAAGALRTGFGRRRHVSGVRRSLRPHLERNRTMNYLTALLVAFLFVYLTAALVRPEWF
jgi:hypothetical protein